MSIANTKQISVTILTKNSERYITQVLQALTSFDEVLVCDTGSSDQTITLAKTFSNVKIKNIPFEGFGKTHNHASSLAKNDWILSLDSDEVATHEFIDEINTITLDQNSVWKISRKNYYRGKWIRGCTWFPDEPLRLYNRLKTSFEEKLVHESINTNSLNIQTIHAYVAHYPFSSIADFLSKIQSYSSLFAEQNYNKRSSSLFKAIFRGLWAFFRSYFLKNGIFLGKEGFIISIYNGHSTFYKYLKLWEKYQNSHKAVSEDFDVPNKT